MNTVITTQEAQQFSIDASHTNVEFVVRHLMISKVRGRFAGVKGTIVLAEGSDLPKSVDVEIDAGSVDTREPQRDEHLRSADFFDVERFPALTYTGRRVEGTLDSFRIHGDLTMHGVTRPVVLEATYEGRGPDPWGGERIGYSATAKLNRKDFGLHWNVALETGGWLVGDTIKIEISAEANRQA